MNPTRSPNKKKKEVSKVENTPLFNIRIDAELKKEFHKQCVINDTNMTDEMIKFITNYTQKKSTIYVNKSKKK